jgi:hypothetical protein
MSRKRAHDNVQHNINSADEKKVPEQLQEPIKRFFPFFNARSADITKQMWLSSKTNTITVPLHRYEPALKRRNKGWFHVNCQTSINKSNNSTLQTMLCSIFAQPNNIIQKKRNRSFMQINDSIDQCSTLRIRFNLRCKRQKLDSDTYITLTTAKSMPAYKIPRGRAVKLRVYPTSDQKALLADWFGCTRYIYNSCISTINQHLEQKHSEPIKLKTLRDKFVCNEGLKKLKPELLAIPWDIR